MTGRGDGGAGGEAYIPRAQYSMAQPAQHSETERAVCADQRATTQRAKQTGFAETHDAVERLQCTARRVFPQLLIESKSDLPSKQPQAAATNSAQGDARNIAFV